EASR
ncbi:putative membrane protein, partial [Vibrio parahaemolyticus V-223/04]